MFHRVKSEITDQENEIQVEEVSVAQAAVAQPAQAQASAPVQQAQQQQQAQAAAQASSSVQKSLVEEEHGVDKSQNEQAAAPKPQNVYQRVGGSAVRPGGVRYSAKPAAPTYKASTPVAPSQSRSSSSDVAQAGDRRLTIGRGITMSGEIESCDYLHVEGTVEAALKGATELNIAESGTFYGTVEIEEATIAGRFEGEIIVNGRLVIESTGVITGSISYRELEVQSGAVIDGRITPITTAKASPAQRSSQESDLAVEAAE